MAIWIISVRRDEVVFPDGRQVGGLSKDQLNLLLQQSISPVTNAPTLNGQTLKDGIIPYFAQDAVSRCTNLPA